MVTNNADLTMRQASLKIVRQENSSSVFWSIYVPAYLNPSGKAGKMYERLTDKERAELQELIGQAPITAPLPAYGKPMEPFA